MDERFAARGNAPEAVSPRLLASWARRGTACSRAATACWISTILSTVPLTLAAQRLPPLPLPVTNAAVASGTIDGSTWVFSVLGIDSTKRWSGITRRASAWNAASGAWRALPDVPGPVGRLASTAQVVRGRLYLFGGYSVDSVGGEKSIAAVDIYDPRTNAWSRGADTPLAVDDAVSGVYRDSLVYLVSGWHDTRNVQSVQVYDVVRNAWFDATPITGPGVFGHSGGLTGNTIVYVDGAVKQDGAVKYRLEPQVWVGTIDTAHPERIAWARGPTHPGPALYRAAVGACGRTIVFAGGTDNAYNYNGIGYDGVPSRASNGVLAFDTRSRRWSTPGAMGTPSMDHRGLAFVGATGWVVGGMQRGQRVSARTVRVPVGRCRR